MTTPPPDSGLVEPWQVQRADGDLIAHEGRPVLKVPGTIERIRLDDSGEWLPRIGEFTDHRRLEWHKFELPATAVAGHGRPAEQTIRLTLFDQHGQPQHLTARLRNGLPRPGHSDQPPAPDPTRDPDDVPQLTEEQAEPWRRAGRIARSLVETHLELIGRLHETAHRDPAMYWVGGAGGVGAWSLPRVLHLWRETAHQPGPRSALIVSLAERLGPTLKRVCHQPRQHLRRQRQLQHAGRIGEADATCIRWLARQPGATVAEKAGARQQALGIARTETADTTENRVVADLLRRAADACDRYLTENEQHPDHEHVRSVAAFRRLLTRLINDSPVGALSPPAGKPRPNNVLLHDPRYRTLWKAYATLLDQRRQRDHAWRWRHRIWAEACEFGILAALQRLLPTSPAHRSDLLLRAAPICGRSIDSRTAIGRWDLLDPEANANASLLFLDGRQFGQFHVGGMLPDGLLRLCPDAVILRRDPARPDKPPNRILAVWSVLDFDLKHDALHDRCRRLDAALRVIPAPNPLEFQGLLIQPKLPAPGATGSSSASAATSPNHTSPEANAVKQPGTNNPTIGNGRSTQHATQDTPDRVDVGCCRGLRLTPPVQHHEPTLAAELRQLLELSP